MNKKIIQTNPAALFDKYFDFSDITVSESKCEINGNIQISELLATKKEFLKQIRGKNIDPIKGFSGYMRNVAIDLIQEKYQIYGDPNVSILSETEELFQLQVNGMLYPKVFMPEIKTLESVNVEHSKDEEHTAYLSAFKSQTKIPYQSDGPIELDDIVEINCIFEDSSHMQEVSMSEVQEPLKSHLIGKSLHESFEYKFDIDNIQKYLDRNPQYSEYKNAFKKYKDIVSKIEIKQIKKYKTPKDTQELIIAMNLKSEDELNEKIKAAINRDLQDLNYAFYRNQISQTISGMQFDMPEKLIRAYENMALSKFKSADNMTAINKFDPEAKDYADFEIKCKKRVRERLSMFFVIEHIRFALQISDEQINKIITTYYGSRLNETSMRNVRNIVILNSYINLLMQTVELLKTDFDSITSAREHVNKLIKTNSYDALIQL